MAASAAKICNDPIRIVAVDSPPRCGFSMYGHADRCALLWCDPAQPGAELLTRLASMLDSNENCATVLVICIFLTLHI